MRIRSILRIIGVLVAGLGVSMFLCALMALFYKEEDLTAFLAAGFVSSAAGLLLFFVGGRARRRLDVSHREAFAVVTFGWLASCLAGALPFFFYAQVPALFFRDAPIIAAGHGAAGVLTALPDCDAGTGLGREFCSFAASMFESTSGFTTTGSSVIETGLWNDIHSRSGGLPHGILFWRALTQFLGGMGIIVFGVALLPLLGVGGMELFKAEVTGPVKDKVAPRIAETARLLWRIYLGMTAVLVVLLMLTGQGLYLSVCHAFATMGTGGFSPLAASVETLDSPAGEWIITVFMALAGMNFALHAAALRKGRPVHLKDQETWFYVGVGVVISLAVGAYLYAHHGYSVNDGIRTGFFNAFSVLTTTGFASTDFALWGIGAQLLLLVLFFVGGCSGSTGGGIKAVRILMMLKVALTELKRLVHPHAVIQTKMSGTPVPVRVINSVAGFIALYLVLFLLAAVILGLCGYDLTVSVTAVGSAIGNIGPGFGAVGPMGNFNFFPDSLKWLQVFLMLAGRLELYSVFIVMTPEFWRR